MKMGMKAPDFTSNGKDGTLEQVMPKVKPDTGAAESLDYLCKEATQ